MTFLLTAISSTVFGGLKSEINPTGFLPDGYVLVDTVFGDLNRDGVEDCVLIIKETDSSKVVTDKYLGRLDRNRRGIVVLFKKASGYELAMKNDDCFSSENEDGGVYFAPELSVEIRKGNLYVRYAHGRYGYWVYTFRFQKGHFELIGYDENDNRGPVVNQETSINFSTKIKLKRVNTNERAEGGDEVFRTTSRKIKLDHLFRLSEIRNFDDLDMSRF